MPDPPAGDRDPPRIADAPTRHFGFRFVSAAEGRARMTLTVAPDNANLGGTLHGGAIATLVDNVGTLAIMSADSGGRPGVTTDLNVTYFAGAALGAAVTADATVLHCGRTLAMVSVDVRRDSDGRLLAQGRMTKFLK